jgi:hypothetical protein
MTLSPATLAALADFQRYDRVYQDQSEPDHVRDAALQARRVAAQAVARRLGEDVAAGPAQLTLGGIA